MYNKIKIKPHTLEERIALFKNKPLAFDPGKNFLYSDSGYILLTYIIEKVSGEKYETFLQEHVFDPLNMQDTGYDSHKRIIKNRASGYSIEGKLNNADYADMSYEAGAGSLYSTVKDLYLWDRALYTEKLLSKESLAKIFTSYKDNYGYGWYLTPSFTNKSKFISHGGMVPGFVSFIGRYVNHNVCIIVLSNMIDTPLHQIVKNLELIVFGQKPELPKKRVTIAVNPQIYNLYVGQYVNKSSNDTFVVTKENDKLFFREIKEAVPYELYPETETNFFLKIIDMQISFIKDENEKVVKLIGHQNGLDYAAEKV